MYVLYLRMILSSLCLAPYLTLPCLAPLQSFPVLPLLFLCSDPGPQCTSMHTLHFTLYISIPSLLCLAPFQSVRVLPVLFLMFWPSPPVHVKDRPYLTRHSLHSSPPQPSRCRLLCLTLLQSFLVILVLPLLFFCFDPPNARPCTDQGGIEPHRHPIATWYIGRKTDHRGHPKWLGNCLKLAGFGTLPPRPPILTSFAMSNFSQAWQLAFVMKCQLSESWYFMVILINELMILWMVAKSCTTRRMFENPRNNGINHCFQLVQDFATIHLRLAMWPEHCAPEPAYRHGPHRLGATSHGASRKWDAKCEVTAGKVFIYYI